MVAAFRGSTLVASSWASDPQPSLRAYGIPGGHGVNFEIPLSSTGEATCVLAINIGQGSSTWLACYHSSIGSYSPVADVSADRDVDDTLAIGGWAFDPSIQEVSTRVSIFIDGQFVTNVAADGPRGELMTLFGWHGDRGFSLNVEADPHRAHRVCASAENIGPDAPNTWMCTDYEP